MEVAHLSSVADGLAAPPLRVWRRAGQAEGVKEVVEVVQRVQNEERRLDVREDFVGDEAGGGPLPRPPRLISEAPSVGGGVRELLDPFCHRPQALRYAMTR